ncbi:MAG: hypothetical protein LBJ67_14685 [Planctomycetaceae bacterium]|jgi:hypothetical protein|nr:hypothetical protein [Planctomycetaceae bacterium]
MKKLNLIDCGLLALIVSAGLGLASFDAACVWADTNCSNTKEAPAACSSCENTYDPEHDECVFGGNLTTPGESGGYVFCSGGGLEVNMDGPFSVTSAPGSRIIPGATEWCTTSHNCVINTTTEPGELAPFCVMKLYSDTAQANLSESCPEQ